MHRRTPNSNAYLNSLPSTDCSTIPQFRTTMRLRVSALVALAASLQPSVVCELKPAAAPASALRLQSLAPLQARQLSADEMHFFRSLSSGTAVPCDSDDADSREEDSREEVDTKGSRLCADPDSDEFSEPGRQLHSPEDLSNDEAEDWQKRRDEDAVDDASRFPASADAGNSSQATTPGALAISMIGTALLAWLLSHALLLDGVRMTPAGSTGSGLLSPAPVIPPARTPAPGPTPPRATPAPTERLVPHRDRTSSARQSRLESAPQDDRIKVLKMSRTRRTATKKAARNKRRRKKKKKKKIPMRCLPELQRLKGLDAAQANLRNCKLLRQEGLTRSCRQERRERKFFRDRMPRECANT